MKKLLLLLASLLQFGCNYNLSKAPLSFQEGLADIAAGTVVSYQTINTNILKPRGCIGCHSNGGGNLGGINLETYENVIAQLGDIKDSVESNRMPKTGQKLTAKERSVLFTWIDAGGPREAITNQTPIEPSPAPTPIPDPPVEPEPEVEFISYETVRVNVLAPRCVSCHSDAGGNLGKTNLETYQNVVALAGRIEIRVANDTMPRAPRGQPKVPLTPEQKTMILKWIANGAPETK